MHRSGVWLQLTALVVLVMDVWLLRMSVVGNKEIKVLLPSTDKLIHMTVEQIYFALQLSGRSEVLGCLTPEVSCNLYLQPFLAFANCFLGLGTFCCEFAASFWYWELDHLPAIFFMFQVLKIVRSWAQILVNNVYARLLLIGCLQFTVVLVLGWSICVFLAISIVQSRTVHDVTMSSLRYHHVVRRMAFYVTKIHWCTVSISCVDCPSWTDSLLCFSLLARSAKF